MEGSKSRTRGSPLFLPILLSSAAFAILEFMLPVYGKRLGASALEIGGMFSVFSVTMTLVRPVVGWAMDRFGRKRFLVLALLCRAGSLVVFAVARDLVGLYLARFAQGIAASLTWISAYAIAADLAPLDARGSAAGRVDEASGRGGLYGALVGFTVLGWVPLATGWPILFAGYALLAAVGAWLIWKNVPETKPTPTAQTRERQATVLSRPLFKLMVIVFIVGGSTAMVSPLLLVLLQDKFTTQVSMLAMAFIPAALINSFLPSRLGRLSDRFGRALMIAIGLTASGLVSLFMPGLPTMAWLVALWALEAFGWAMASPAQEALVADLTARETRGTAYGLYSFASSLGATFGPLVGGWLYDAVGHAVPFYLNGLVLFFGAFWVLVLLSKPSRSGVLDASAQD
jgi:DHA1 family multidrug resistance protein-like MFS transporter